MQVIELPDRQFAPLSMAFAPDGGSLAAWSWGRVCVLDTASGTVRRTIGDKVSGMVSVPGVGFTADGRAVVVASRYVKPPVRVYDLDSGEVLREYPDFDGLEVAPGGRVYATRHPKPYWVEIVRWNPLTGEVLPPFAHHKGYLRQLAVSADEKWVAGSTAYSVRVWNLGGPRPPARAARQFESAHYSCIYGLALSADGAFVAYNPPGVHVGNVKTGEVWKVSETGARHSREVAFHPSRPLLAYSGAGPEVVFYDVAARAELKRFAWNVGNVTATCFSPDGLRCAAGAAGKVVVWDVDA